MMKMTLLFTDYDKKIIKIQFSVNSSHVLMKNDKKR
jgi:hypothetical protein